MEETGQRLNRVERDLATVTTEVKSLTHVVTDLAAGIKGLQTLIAQKAQTDWKTVFAGIALILTFGGLAIQPLRNDIQVNRVRLQVIDQKATEGSKDRWTKQDHDTYAVRVEREDRRFHMLAAENAIKIQVLEKEVDRLRNGKKP